MTSKFKLANAPDDQPIAFDLTNNKLYLDIDSSDDESAIPLDSAFSVAQMNGTVQQARPQWLLDFFAQMGDYVKQADSNAEIDNKTGMLILDPKIPKDGLRKVCEHLAWLYEAQYRQNKEILLWIGEIILDFMARDHKRGMSMEEAIEELGLLDRQNGVKWKLKTLARWPVVIQRIPPAIRQLPIPPTYLSEAALFAHPEDPVEKVKFSNARDAMLVAVAEKPNSWSRAKFVACMKELQDHFGMERTRNEGVASLQERLIAYYRLQREAERSGDMTAYYANVGLDRTEAAAWIINIESELQNRGRLAIDPKDAIPRGDGLTQSARDRIARIAAKRKGGNR